LRTEPWFGGRLAVSRAATQFNEQGEVASEELLIQLREFVAGFVAFVQAHERPHDD
jgi:hypothetical protein